jgi:hypothetical protein
MGISPPISRYSLGNKLNLALKSGQGLPILDSMTSDSIRNGVLASNVAPPEAVAAERSAHEQVYAAMRRQLRSWGLWQTALGALHLVAAGTFDASWGIMLIAVGLSSFWFRSAAMFVVYATTLIWAALSNLTGAAAGGNTGWLGFGLIQVYFAYRVWRQFRAFVGPDRALRSMPGANRARVVFPLAAVVLGPLALVGVGAVMTGVLAESMPNADLLLGLVVNGAVLAFALALASLLSGFRPRGLAVTGLVTSGIAVLVWAGLLIF